MSDRCRGQHTLTSAKYAYTVTPRIMLTPLHLCGTASFRRTLIINYTPVPNFDSQNNGPDGISLACLSCHDGTVAVDAVVNQPKSREIVDTGVHYQMKPGDAESGAMPAVSATAVTQALMAACQALTMPH